jgi:hypothetical protein
MSFHGAARRYYPPNPVEIVRLAASVAITPILALAHLFLCMTRRGSHPTWTRFKRAVDRLFRPRAHASLAQAARRDLFGEQPDQDPDQLTELEACVVNTPAFIAYLRAVVREHGDVESESEVEEIAREILDELRREPADGNPAGPISQLALESRRAVAASGVRDELASIVESEAARSDVLNSALTAVTAKLALGQLKLGAYGIAIMIAPSLYFRWSPHRDEKIRRTIDGLLPDGPWSLSRVGWSFDWTESIESMVLVAGLFLAASAVLAVLGYLMAPILSPMWRRTGLPEASLRRAVAASRHAMTGGPSRPAIAPEVFASKIADFAELFSRSPVA